MNSVRIGAAVALAAGLLAAPVVTPAWAAPKPVAPVTHTTAIGGVDPTALGQAPAAFDPQALAAADAKSAAKNPAGSPNAPGAAAPGKTPDATPSAPVARASGAARPAVLTRELDADRFTAAGITWKRAGAPKTVTVQVRVRQDGQWSDWFHLEREGGPDSGSAEGKRAAAKDSTEPITAAHGEAIQVRVDTDSGAVPAELSLVTVDPGTSPADANLAGAPVNTAHAGTRSPNIISRAQWGADESLRPSDCSPEYSSTLKAAVVHHTVNANTYTAAESAGLVRSIYAFHVQGRGWCDVGYQFLVDRYGQIFEGRAGGADRPVIGAQAGGFNTYTVGVSGIGDFTSAAPTSAMVASVSQVVGWKLGLHNRDPFGRVTLVSAGGDATGYPSGTPVPVNVVLGHRDVDLTGCPGDAFYPLLASIRSQAATYRSQQSYLDQDLYGVWGTTIWPPAGRVEIHAQSSASGYFWRMTDVATRWASGKPEDWRFFLGSASGDTRPDLIGVHATNTASGFVEVKVASWASYYQETTVNTVTPARTFKPDQTTQLAVGGPSGGDVYIIAIQGTGTGRVELHRLSADSQYRQWSLNTATGLSSGYNTSQNRFLIARGSGDLYYVAHGWTGTARSEVWALSASSGFTRYIWGAATPVGYTSDADSQWVLGAGSVPDLFWVQASRTGSGRVEIHALSPWSQYGSWTLHAATSLPALAPPGWQFSVG